MTNDVINYGDISDAISRAKSFWHKLEGVLICADKYVIDTEIKDAQHVVHYSLPLQKFTDFMFRLSTMLDYYGDSITDVSK